jgi:hypothetical protein
MDVQQSWAATIDEIPLEMQGEMRGRSWHADPACPAFEDLRLLGLWHHGFDGARRRGELVVHQRIAEEVVQIFEQLYALGFAIERMQRIDVFGGDDAASMAANNSSASTSDASRGPRRSRTTRSDSRSISTPCRTPGYEGSEWTRRPVAATSTGCTCARA